MSITSTIVVKGWVWRRRHQGSLPPLQQVNNPIKKILNKRKRAEYVVISPRVVITMWSRAKGARASIGGRPWWRWTRTLCTNTPPTTLRTCTSARAKLSSTSVPLTPINWDVDVASRVATWSVSKKECSTIVSTTSEWSIGISSTSFVTWFPLQELWECWPNRFAARHVQRPAVRGLREQHLDACGKVSVLFVQFETFRRAPR